MRHGNQLKPFYVLIKVSVKNLHVKSIPLKIRRSDINSNPIRLAICQSSKMPREQISLKTCNRRPL